MNGWKPAVVVGLIYSAGIIFVVVFTYIAVSEREGRAEVERLATELAEANRKLHAYAMQVEELATTKERNRLAREIHDSLGHYLTVINVQIEAARAVMNTDHANALACLGKAQSLTQEGLTEVRRSVAALHASPTENRSLTESVSALATECRAAGITTELVIAGTERPLGPQAELTLYRAAQEGLTNVRKHAQASRATVTLDYRATGAARIVIEDDGVGSGETGGGFGLLGVRQRAQLLGGEVRIESEAGQGFRLEVELPA
jgi:signal transduction histidine kinase